MPLELVDPGALGIPFEVEEDGETIRENARKKAEAGLRRTGLPALGDDSALEVSALQGGPGVHSARFAGRDRSFEERMDLLVQAVDAAGVGASRAATFRCAAVLLLPDGRLFEGEGVLEGAIARRPGGRLGFGYDPIFVLPDGRHLAELSLEEKNLQSHRARALAALEVRGAFDALLRC